MHEIVLEEASAARKNIECMIKKGSVDCRVHLLWNKLLSNSSSVCLLCKRLLVMDLLRTFLYIFITFFPFQTIEFNLYNFIITCLPIEGIS